MVGVLLQEIFNDTISRGVISITKVRWYGIIYSHLVTIQHAGVLDSY